jgi:hypothetical protein
MNTQGNSVGGGGATATSFMNAVQDFTNTQNGTGMVRGENGALAHSMYHMSGDTNTSLQGALVAAWNGMLRGTTRERAYELLNNALGEARGAGGNFEAGAIADLFVVWAHCRDRTEGKGERLVSYFIFMWLYEHFRETATVLLKQYPTLGYWKDLSHLYAQAHGKGGIWDGFQTEIVNMFADQLRRDTEELRTNSESTNVTLCAKYVPKEGRSFDKKTGITKRIAQALFPEDFKTDFRRAMSRFRKLYTPLNKYIDTVEVKECSGRWGDIDFNRVPGRVLNIHRKAFLNVKKGNASETRRPDNADRVRCRENFQTHLNRAVQGKVEVKGKMMFIHELIGQIIDGKLNTPEERMLVEAQWNTHVESFRKTMEETESKLGKGVCLIDVSSSMYGTPLNVAVALGIFASSFAHEAFRDRFISFESQPHWIDLRYPRTASEFGIRNYCNRILGNVWDPSRVGKPLTLYEKAYIATLSPWGGSTDFVAAHELILHSCVKAKLQSEDLPEWFMICSDMQFNSANYNAGSYPFMDRYHKMSFSSRQTNGLGYGYYNRVPAKPWSTINDGLTKAYRNAGMAVCGKPYEVPQQIYWNLRGGTVGFPVQSDTPNTQMVSGFSVALLKLFLTDAGFEDYVQPVPKKPPTPYDTYRKAVDSEHYYPVRKVCSMSTEGTLRGYTFVEPELEDYEVIDMK